MENQTVETPKAVRVPKASVTNEGLVLKFEFANGNEFRFGYSDLTEELRIRAAMHGLEQKIRDSYAGAKSADEAQGLAEKVIDTLREGKWNAGRADGGPSEDSLDLLAQAVVNAYAAQGVAKDLAAMRTALEALDKAGRAKIRAKGSVMIELAKIKAARQTGAEDIGL